MRALPALVLLVAVSGCRHRVVIPGQPAVPLSPSVSTYSVSGNSTESVPSGMPSQALLDEATIGVEPYRTCASVVLRQPVGWDQPASQLAPRCANGRDKVEGMSMNERVGTQDYPIVFSPPTLELYGRGVGLSIPLGDGQPGTFRVVERSFTVCCPITAGEVFKLTLSGRWGAPGGNRTLRTDFQWRLQYPPAG